MPNAINVRTIEAPNELDQNTMYGLIYLTNHLPESSDMHGASHSEIQTSLEGFVDDPSFSTAIMIAEQEPLGRAVGYATAQIDPQTHELAEIKQLAVAPQTNGAREIGNLLIRQVETWGEQYDARVVLSDEVEFTGRVIGKHIVEVVHAKDTLSAHPDNYLG